MRPDINLLRRLQRALVDPRRTPEEKVALARAQVGIYLAQREGWRLGRMIKAAAEGGGR